jgi:hypothetical protein
MHVVQSCVHVRVSTPIPGGLHGVEVRVGNIKPGPLAPTVNNLCKTFVGPSAAGQVVTLMCNTPVAGRYLTLQVVSHCRCRSKSLTLLCRPGLGNGKHTVQKLQSPTPS